MIRDKLRVRGKCGHYVTVHIPGGIKGPISPDAPGKAEVGTAGRRNINAGHEALCVPCGEKEIQQL